MSALRLFCYEIIKGSITFIVEWMCVTCHRHMSQINRFYLSPVAFNILPQKLVQ